MNNDQRALRFAVFGKAFQNDNTASVQRMFSVLTAHGVGISVESSFFKLLKEHNLDIRGCTMFDNDQFVADFVISLGGDGTFLKTASLVGNKDIPIIGVNMGRLGFLTDVGLQEVESALNAIFLREYEVENRSVIVVESEGEPLHTYPFALNDVAILKCADASMITIQTSIDGEHLLTCQTDGMVVSTPTGSTAYALSNGGPIVVPQTNVFSLTSVAPHSLTVRPIIVPDTAEISLRVESRSHNYLVAVDGRSVSLSENTSLVLRKAPYNIKIVKRKGYSYFSMLKEKMMWGKDKRVHKP